MARRKTNPPAEGAPEDIEVTPESLCEDEQEEQDNVETEDDSPPVEESGGVFVPDGHTLSPFMAQLMSGHETKFGKEGQFIGRSQDRYTVVLPGCPLVLQYLIGINGEPLRKPLFVAGPPKSYKTSFLLDTARRVMVPPVNGDAFVVNTESKWSASKSEAILLDMVDRFALQNVTSLNDWQMYATRTLTAWHELGEKVRDANNPRKKNKDTKYTGLTLPPLFIGVDSMVGAQTEMIQERIMKDGHGGKTFYDRAQMVHQWLQSIGKLLLGTPVLIMITNHETEDSTAFSPNPNIKPMKTAGGFGPGFHCAYDIRMKQVKAESTGDRKVITLRLRTKYNSVGPSPRTIVVPYIEAFDESRGHQVDKFDWDAALIDMLLERLKEPGYGERIRNVLGNLTEYTITGMGKVYSCERLGIDKSQASDPKWKKDSDNAFTASKVGSMIQGDPEVLKGLQDAIGIKRYDTWNPSISF